MKNCLTKIAMMAASLILSAGLSFAVEVKVAAPDSVGAAKAAGDTAAAAKDSAKGTAAAAKGAAADTKAGAKAAVADTKAAAKSKVVDINTATEAELKSIPGVGDSYASKIIAGRPYANKSQLKSRKILPGPVYEQVKDLVVAKQVKK